VYASHPPLLECVETETSKRAMIRWGKEAGRAVKKEKKLFQRRKEELRVCLTEKRTAAADTDKGEKKTSLHAGGKELPLYQNPLRVERVG